MIGIIVAMNSEFNKEFKIKKNCHIHISTNQKFYIFNCLKQSFILVFSSVGKANAAATTINLIKTFPVKKIINLGTAGSSYEPIKHNDYVIASSFQYLDVDVTAFGYEIGQIPKEKKLFKACSYLNENLIHLLISKHFNYHHGPIGSLDTFINQDNLHMFLAKGINDLCCFDMEATAIAQICDQQNVPFAAVKIISDKINDSNSNQNQFKNNLKIIADNLTDLFFNIIDHFNEI